MTPMKPVIFGCAGLALSEEERRFFAAERPCGLIVFKRNCASTPQLKALIASFREIVGDPLAPAFVDQEGGRVLRLKAPAWWHAPASGKIGKLADADLAGATQLARDTGACIGAQLAEVGINVNFAPCLDVLFPWTHNAIGDRAFHRDPKVVAQLGRAYADGMATFDVQATLKHLPGHGRAKLDSHYDLPVIDASRADLDTDLAPFRALNDLPWGIISHLVFPALDDSEPATTSRRIVDKIVRDAIGFKGLLVTDDISMKALKAPVEVSSVRALDAGCDIVCHCNGDMAEMTAIAAALGPMTDTLAARFAAVRKPAHRVTFAEVANLAASIDARVARI